MCCFEVYFIVLLQINEDDILPKNVCQQCLIDLTFVYEFNKKCQKSEAILQQSLILRENAMNCNKDALAHNEVVIENEIVIKVEEHDLTFEPDFEIEADTKYTQMAMNGNCRGTYIYVIDYLTNITNLKIVSKPNSL